MCIRDRHLVTLYLGLVAPLFLSYNTPVITFVSLRDNHKRDNSLNQRLKQEKNKVIIVYDCVVYKICKKAKYMVYCIQPRKRLDKIVYKYAECCRI